MPVKYQLIFDFDSTFIQMEALDELAEIVLADGGKNQKLIKEIKTITRQGMEGLIPFSESLKRRFSLIKPERKHLKKLINILKNKVTRSIKKNKDFFQKYKDNIYIVSGGFKDYIIPITADFGIPENHIHCNRSIFDRDELLTDKAQKIRQLNLSQAVMIGDGYTDYEVKQKGAAKIFIAYCENVRRKIVVEKADYTANNFSELILILNNLDKGIKLNKI